MSKMRDKFKSAIEAAANAADAERLHREARTWRRVAHMVNELRSMGVTMTDGGELATALYSPSDQEDDGYAD